MANLSDLIAQSTSDNPQKLVNLALATQMMGSGSGLEGTNYIFVKGGGTPQENALELQAAYNQAKKMPRFLGTISSGGSYDWYKGQTVYFTSGVTGYYTVSENFTGNIFPDTDKFIPSSTSGEYEKSVRSTVVIAPGEYKFGTSAFTVDTPYINIVSLTGNADVLLDGINVTADNVYLKGLNCGVNTFTVATNLNGLSCERCVGGDGSFGGGGDASGTFENCTGGNGSFGGDGGTASGTFINCAAGDNSFGSGGELGGGTVSDTARLNNCTGGDYSFGGGGTALGTYNHCIGGFGSFGGYGGRSFGTFNHCTGDDDSFGGGQGEVSGTFNNCAGGAGSFGNGEGGSITSTARLYYCRLTSGSFPTPEPGGKLVLCIDGNDTVVTTP